MSLSNEPARRRGPAIGLKPAAFLMLICFGGGVYLGTRLSGFRGVTVRPVAEAAAPIAPTPPTAPLAPSVVPPPESAAAPVSPTAPVPDGSTLPDAVRNAALKTLDGQTIRLADYAGKTVVLELWASWCPSCRAQAPHLVRLKNELSGKPVEIIALSVEDPVTEGEKVRAAARELGLNYTAAFLPRDLALTFAKTENGGIPIPQTIVLTPDGRIAKHVVGFDPDKDLAEIRRIIEQGAPSVAAVPGILRGGA